MPALSPVAWERHPALRPRPTASGERHAQPPGYADAACCAPAAHAKTAPTAVPSFAPSASRRVLPSLPHTALNLVRGTSLILLPPSLRPHPSAPSPAVFSPLPRRCRSRRHGRHLWRGCCDATPSPRVSPRGRAHYAGARRHTLDSVWATVDALARDRQPNAWRRRAGQSPLVGSDLMCGTSALVTYLAAGMPLPSPPRVSERTGGAGSPRAGAGQ
jgi:hypothetical protein